jgi:hypothetical protein
MTLPCNVQFNVLQVMDATRKTEDEVCTALHDCDNDLDRAVNMLLEGEAQVYYYNTYFLFI